eukprot:UC4_evm1s432
MVVYVGIAISEGRMNDFALFEKKIDCQLAKCFFDNAVEKESKNWFADDMTTYRAYEKLCSDIEGVVYIKERTCNTNGTLSFANSNFREFSIACAGDSYASKFSCEGGSLRQKQCEETGATFTPSSDPRCPDTFASLNLLDGTAVGYNESNPWYGMKKIELVGLGAKIGICMRIDHAFLKYARKMRNAVECTIKSGDLQWCYKNPEK